MKCISIVHNVYNEDGSLMQRKCRYYVNKIVRLICSYDVFAVSTSKGYKECSCYLLTFPLLNVLDDKGKNMLD